MPLLTNRGVWLPDRKKPAADRPIEDLAAVARVLLPLSFGGEEAKSVLHSYATVLHGQAIATPKKKTGVSAVSSVTGVAGEEVTLLHPVYGKLRCVALDCMDIRRPVPTEKTDVSAVSAAGVIESARTCAVLDELDGLYLYKKLQQWTEEGCDVLVGDAVENQPYGSAAWEVLNESVEQVFFGLQLAARALGVENFHLATQPLPQNHRRALCQRLGDEKKLFTVRKKYPAVSYTEKPLGKRVRRIGVQALLALYRAVAFHEAHTSCVVTVAGEAVATPRNLRVPFGTPASELLRQCGLAADPTRIIYGDIMTGYVAETADAPILAGVTCLLAITEPDPQPADVCVGCGRCVQVCHAGLMPSAIMQAIRLGQTDRLAPLHAEECDGCGACAVMCPAGLDLAAQIAAVGETVKEANKNE